MGKCWCYILNFKIWLKSTICIAHSFFLIHVYICTYVHKFKNRVINSKMQLLVTSFLSLKDFNSFLLNLGKDRPSQHGVRAFFDESSAYFSSPISRYSPPLFSELFSASYVPWSCKEWSLNAASFYKPPLPTLSTHTYTHTLPLTSWIATHTQHSGQIITYSKTHSSITTLIPSDSSPSFSFTFLTFK